MKETLNLISHPKQLFEKEYYFDEGLGQSLEDHVKSIKENYPVVEVETRRDRDGFAIVKTKFRPKFKYDLSMLDNHNPKETQSLAKETLEGVLRSIVP